MSPLGDLSQVPTEFMAALSALRRAQCRTEMRLAEIPAPSRLAPFAVALGADVFDSPGSHAAPSHGPATAAAAEPGIPPIATGRFILLHDPTGPPLWDGTFRIVTYIRAELEPDMGNDELLGSVAWTWLVDALEGCGASYRAAGGTATRILSQSYGTLSGRPDSIDIELRASWTPETAGLESHLEAWSEMVCTFAGLPPLSEDVAVLPRRRLNQVCG